MWCFKTVTQLLKTSITGNCIILIIYTISISNNFIQFQLLMLTTLAQPVSSILHLQSNMKVNLLIILHRTNFNAKQLQTSRKSRGPSCASWNVSRSIRQICGHQKCRNVSATCAVPNSCTISCSTSNMP